MYKINFIIGLLLSAMTSLSGQTIEQKEIPKKGSYLYYHQPAFEDNSFLLEEAFNQPRGVIQNIMNLNCSNARKGNIYYSFTQEIPVTDKHQISYTINYNILQPDNRDGKKRAGFGDVYISYRPALSGKNDKALVIPKFTVILPTGNASAGHGYGGWGGEVSLAITKRLSPKTITHYNIGYTFISQADYFSVNDRSKDALPLYHENLYTQSFGASIIWYPVRKMNLMIESYSVYKTDFKEVAAKTFQTTINPAFRFVIDNGRTQIVPGLGIPSTFENGKLTGVGLFFYLSIEPDYLAFYKTKER
jgi:hypothetical protein